MFTKILWTTWKISSDPKWSSDPWLENIAWVLPQLLCRLSWILVCTVCPRSFCKPKDQISWIFKKKHLKKKMTVQVLAIWGIWIPDQSGMVKSCPIIEWSVIQMVIWIPDYFSCYLNGDLKTRKFVHFFLAGLVIGTGHLKNGWSEYQAFKSPLFRCLLFRSSL